MFNLAKSLMEKTKLWRIAERMPKGALLHCHLSATVDMAWLFETAINTPGMKFSAACPLTSAKVLNKAGVSFRFYKSAPEVKESIWESNYVANSWVDVQVAADTFPEGGRKGFIKWLQDRTCIVEEESIQHHLGVDDIWRKFGGAFIIIESVLYYEPILRAFLQKLFRTLTHDGVQWVELRDCFEPCYRRQDCEEPDQDCNEMVHVIGEEIEKFKKTEEGKNFWGARIIWTALRSNSSEKIINSET